MRRRILRTTLGTTLGLIALMTGLMLWGDWIGNDADYERRLDTELDQVASQLHEDFHGSGDALSTEQVDRVLPAGRRVEVTFVDGERLVVGTTDVTGPSAVLVVEGLGSLRLVDTTGALGRTHLVASTVIIGAGLLLAALAVLVLTRMSRRLTEPFEDLVAHAERMQNGDLRMFDRHYGIEEFDRLVAAMNASVSRVQALLAEERRLTIDASHQLKTPLTALSLRLDELSELRGDPEVRAEVLLALEQVERLSAVVDDLLVERRSADARRVQVPLAVVVEQQRAEWQQVFTARDRTLRVVGAPSEGRLVDPGPVGQVIATLLENSLQHGAGATTIAVRDPNGTPWVEVSDEGPGVPDDIAATVFEREVSGGGGTGLGLAAAQDAAVSVGGRLALVSRRPARFRLFLDLREDPTPVGPEPEERAQGESDDVRREVVRER
jgi:signal transduction histidine kinase